MPKHRRLLIVVADGEHARFVRRAAGHALHTETAFDSTASHKQSSDLGTDHPGAAMHTGSAAHHALAPRHDLHVMEKEKFAHFVAQQINAAPVADAFDALLLVAPQDSLDAIRGALDTVTRAKIVATLPKDLVKTPDNELWPHIAAEVSLVSTS